MSSHRSTVVSAPELLLRVRQLISGDADFNTVALELFAFQFEHVPIYRRLCEKRGATPATVKHWEEIPALPTSAFKEHIVSSLPENDRPRVFHSSGTTEQIPSRHFHNVASISIYEASILQWFEKNFISEIKSELSYIFLTPPPVHVPHSSLVHMFEIIRQKFGGKFVGILDEDGSWRLDFDQLGRMVSSHQPVALLGTAFSFVHWLDRLAVNKTRLRLPAGSRIMETGGYKGRSRIIAKSELRRLMTRYLGVPESAVVTEYGMSELSSQAYAEAGGLFLFPPWVRTQVISPETGAVVAPGETGLLRVFDVANINSVMAIQTEDLAIRRAGGFELLGRVESSEPRGCSLMAST
jgi:hypothetical protein